MKDGLWGRWDNGLGPLWTGTAASTALWLAASPAAAQQAEDQSIDCPPGAYCEAVEVAPPSPAAQAIPDQAIPDQAAAEPAAREDGGAETAKLPPSLDELRARWQKLERQQRKLRRKLDRDVPRRDASPAKRERRSQRLDKLARLDGQLEGLTVELVPLLRGEVEHLKGKRQRYMRARSRQLQSHRGEPNYETLAAIHGDRIEAADQRIAVVSAELSELEDRLPSHFNTAEQARRSAPPPPVEPHQWIPPSPNAVEVPDGHILPAWVMVSLMMGAPTGVFADHMGEVAPGVEIVAGYAFLDGWLAVGAELGFLHFFERGLTHPDPDTEGSLSSNGVLGHLFARAQWPGALLLPYVEGLVGFKHFSSSTAWSTYTGSETHCSWSDGCDTVDYYDESSSSIGSDTAWSAGLGMGVDMRLGGPSSLAAVLGVSLRYLIGGPASYVTGGSTGVEPGTAAYTAADTSTDMLVASLGFGLAF
ncbi:MAG: hypothetical protein JRI68_33780 [Deltaproteobacteria bacterium]|nr:hypothetical protein [Deltaproteobacteria bacterium]